MQTELIRLIYHAVEEPRLWQEVLRRIARHSDSSHCFLMSRHTLDSQPLGFFEYGFQGNHFEDYQNHFYQVDVWSQALLPHKDNRFHPSHQVYDDQQFLQSEIYCDFARPRGIRHSIGCLIHHDNQLITELGFMRSQGQSHYSDAHIRASNHYVPHIEQAMNMAERRQSLLTRCDQMTAVFDSQSSPSFLCSAKGAIHYQNSGAGEFLQRSGLFRGLEGQLWFRNTDHQLTFNRLLHEAVAFVDGKRQTTPKRSLLSYNGKVVWLTVKPWTWSSTGVWGLQENCGVLVSFEPCASSSKPQPDWIAQLFGLTLAEAEICSGLCVGRTVDIIATERSVSVTTVRQQIKSCLRKTASGTQGQMIAKILLQLTH